MFASEKWYNIELAWYEWEGFREALKKDGEEWGTMVITLTLSPPISSAKNLSGSMVTVTCSLLLSLFSLQDERTKAPMPSARRT